MTGLIGWWPLNEDSGTTAYDLSGKGNHGSLNGGVTQGVAGKGGLTSYSFDGNDGYIDVPVNSPLDGINDGSYTFSVWIRTTSTSYGYIAELADPAGHRIFDPRMGSDGKIAASRASDDDSGDDPVTTTSLNDGVWHHYVLKMDGSASSQGTMYAYVDGELEDIGHDDDATSGSATSFVIGCRNDGSPPTGVIEASLTDVRVYNRALTPQEIQTLYEWGNGDYARPLNDQNSSSAVSRWPLDGNADDLWGSNSGSVSGPSVVDGVRGEAYDFNDSGDEIVVSNSSALHGNGTDNFSVSAWVKPHSISDDGSNDRNIFAILRRSGVDPRVGWTLSFNSRSELDFLMEDSSNNLLRPTYSRSSDFDLSSWYHVVGTREGDTGRLYVNGVEKASAKTSGFGDISTSEELYIGQTNDTDSNYPDALNGSVDDVRIYDKALSPSEVFELYRWGTRGRDMRKLTVNSR